jgi:N-acetylmuramoyl-L-alanine amidase
MKKRKTTTMNEQDKHFYNLDVLARTIYGEARSEFSQPEGGLSALVAIANVVMNRTRAPQRFGKTLSEVCLKPYQFSCWNMKDPNYQIISSVQSGDNPVFDLCWHVAENVYQKKWPDLTQGSDHYYASWLSYPPAWAKGIKPNARIGQHLFFKLYPEERG